MGLGLNTHMFSVFSNNSNSEFVMQCVRKGEHYFIPIGAQQSFEWMTHYQKGYRIIHSLIQLQKKNKTKRLLLALRSFSISKCNL